MPRPRKVLQNEAPQTPQAQPVVVPPTHDQWEYRTLRSADGDEWDTPFSTVGHNGWELCSIYAVWDAHTAPRYRAVFKRKAGNG